MGPPRPLLAVGPELVPFTVGESIVNGSEHVVGDHPRSLAHSEGHQFGPYGEKRAWWTHRSCLPRDARLALWCETRAQNCWTNAGPHMVTGESSSGELRLKRRGEDGWAPISDRPYAQQKCVRVPSALT